MTRTQPGTSRTGALVPLAAICLIGLVGLVAMAIDIALVLVARTQAQNAADAAAMAACRSLDGIVSANNNIDQAFINGRWAATQANILGSPIVTDQVDLKIGVLEYDKTQNPPRFVLTGLTSSSGAPPSGHNWGAAEATVSSSATLHFARVFGMASMPVDATAQAIHRPRDVAIIMDYSGSMTFDSYLAAPKNNDPNYLNPPYRSLNNDSRVPAFGHYDANTTSSGSSNNPDTGACLVNSEISGYSGDYLKPSKEVLKIGNQTATTTSGPPIIEDFYTVAASGGMVKAFNNGSASSTPVTDYDSHGFPSTIPGYSGTNPGGIRPLRVNSRSVNISSPPYTYSYSAGTDYAKNVMEVLGIQQKPSTPSTTLDACPTIRRKEWEGTASLGSNSGNSFYATTRGYTFGPGYWGKTFFVWPPNPDDTPNPRNPSSSSWTNHNNSSDGGPIRDWRQRFYWKIDSSGNRYRLDDNNVLWNSSGNVRSPDQSDPYYDPDGRRWTYEINYEAVLWWLKNDGPNPLPTNLRSGRILYYDDIPNNVDNASSDLNKLFWREYIEYVFGWEATRKSGWGSSTTVNLLSGYGNDFRWETSSASAAIYTKPGNQHLIGRVNRSGGYSRGHGPNQDIRVKLPSSLGSTGVLWETPVAGDKIQFSNHSTIYTIKSVNTSTNPWSIRLEDDLSTSVGNSTNITLVRQGAYMDYRDNPYRPKMRWWFGPLSFSDFLFCEYDSSFRSWRPGNCHEAPLWVLKTGIQSALEDIEKNHPNDWVTLAYFSVPKKSSSDSSYDHRFNRSRGALGKNYTYMRNALWYPPAVLNNDGTLVARSSTSPPGEIRPWTSSFGMDSDYREAPFGLGGTCPSWGFQLVYNQFSSNDSLVSYDSGQPSGMAGGNGRLGARKMVIFETDGVPNHSSSSSFQNSGPGRSYWKCRMPNEYPNVTSDGNMDKDSLNACYDAVRILCDNETGTRPGNVSCYLAGGTTTTKSLGTGKPGYATTGKPVLVHALAFGGLFESTSNLKDDCLRFLQSVQAIGGTQPSAAIALPSYKVITGTSDERIDKIRTAFTIMMQDGVQITLYK